MAESITRYDRWGQVPENLHTKTQLANLDLPRVPEAAPVAYVYERGPHGRKGSFYLYDEAASLPSPASARQLEAARARQNPTLRVCAECGARPDHTPTLAPDESGADRGAIPLCRACLHIARLRRRQRNTAEESARAAGQAAAWLADDRAAVVYVATIAPPPGENARPKKPIALSLGAVTPSGAVLAGINIRLNKSRNPLIPADAIPADQAIPALRELFAGRDVIRWADDSLKYIWTALPIHDPAQRRELIVLDRKVAEWRGEIDPCTYRLTYSLDPGRADLMALLIRRMAATGGEL
jgi:hypothetical protein